MDRILRQEKTIERGPINVYCPKCGVIAGRPCKPFPGFSTEYEARRLANKEAFHADRYLAIMDGTSR